VDLWSIFVQQRKDGVARETSSSSQSVAAEVDDDNIYRAPASP
jgi:hypothetical protein